LPIALTRLFLRRRTSAHWHLGTLNTINPLSSLERICLLCHGLSLGGFLESAADGGSRLGDVLFNSKQTTATPTSESLISIEVKRAQRNQRQQHRSLLDTINRKKNRHSMDGWIDRRRLGRVERVQPTAIGDDKLETMRVLVRPVMSR
jgi:hypothetical protein